MEHQTSTPNDLICTVDGKFCFHKKDLMPSMTESFKPMYQNQPSALKLVVMLRSKPLGLFILLLSILGLFQYGNDGWAILHFVGFVMLCVGVFALQAFAGVASVWFMPIIYDVLITWTGVGYNWLTLLTFSICAATGLVAHLLLWFGAGGVSTLIAQRKNKSMPMGLAKQK